MTTAEATRALIASLWPPRFWPTVRTLFILLLLATAAILGLVIAGEIPIQGSGGGGSGVRPYEYVYLDTARVESYLGQIDDGQVKQETRTASSKETAGGKFEIKSLAEASGSVTNEKTSSAVVSFSDADNFYRLEKQLEEDGAITAIPLSAGATAGVRSAVKRKVAHRHGLSGHERRASEHEGIETEYEAELEHLPVGRIVKLEDVLLHVPPYLAAYPSLRYAIPRFNPANEVFEAAPLYTFSAAEVELEESAKKERERFIKRAGANPRLPLSSTLHHLTIVIPARYAYLTGDPSLLNASVTVVGKLVQKGEDFGDGASEATYLPALLKAKPPFLRDLGVKESFLHKYRHNAPAMDRELFKALQRSLTFTGRSVEVIPIAIYE
jgi:hypothetical protein